MSLKKPAITLAAAAFFAAIGSGSVSAQENCGAMYQHVMGAYQAQSPYYSQLLSHYNARCLSGSSQPTWGGGNRHRYDNDRVGYDNDRRGYDNDRWRRGW